jgi:hypothetical protein
VFQSDIFFVSLNICTKVTTCVPVRYFLCVVKYLYQSNNVCSSPMCSLVSLNYTLSKNVANTSYQFRTEKIKQKKGHIYEMITV